MSISLVPDALLPDYRAVTPDFLRERGWPEELLDDIFSRNLSRVMGGTQ